MECRRWWGLFFLKLRFLLCPRCKISSTPVGISALLQCLPVYTRPTQCPFLYVNMPLSLGPSCAHHNNLLFLSGAAFYATVFISLVQHLISSNIIMLKDIKKITNLITHVSVKRTVLISKGIITI